MWAEIMFSRDPSLRRGERVSRAKVFRRADLNVR